MKTRILSQDEKKIKYREYMKEWYRKQSPEKKEKIKERVNQYQHTNKDKSTKWKQKWRESNREHERLYAKEHRQIPEVKEERRVYEREYYKNNVVIRREKEIRYKIKYPEKVQARWDANNKLKTGSRCEYCGDTNNLHKHHEDYTKPLEVVTLCNECHYKLHQGLISLKEINN
jgi:hypothetical protein